MERVHETREEIRVARETRRMRIDARASLAGPIRCDQSPPAREPVGDVFEVAAAMGDRMQPDDGKSLSAIVVGNRDSVHGYLAAVWTCAGRKTFWWCHRHSR